MTLGLVLTLGAVTGGRGQELSSSVTPSSASLIDGLVLPAVPENWADLPFRLTASQTLSYNSNVSSIPVGLSSLVPGAVLGDFTTTSSFGFSTKANVYGQQLYLDATFGVIRYLHSTGFNSDVYTISAGDNWTLTSRCAGNLGVTLSKSPAAVTELVGTGVNYLTTTALNETGKCAVSNGYSLVFNGSLGNDTNSNPVDAVNNSRTTMIAAGISYDKGPSNVTALASISDSVFSNRGAGSSIVGLASEVAFHSFTLKYTRELNPNLSVGGMIGLVGVTDSFSFGLPKTLLPIYSINGKWAITPKLEMTASASKTVSPPTTIIGNAQTDYSADITMAYQLTPKLVANATGTISYTNSAFTSGLTNVSPLFVSSQDFYSVTAGLTYLMTPFLSATLNASYTERVADHQITPQDVITVGLSYRPY